MLKPITAVLTAAALIAGCAASPVAPSRPVALGVAPGEAPGAPALNLEAGLAALRAAVDAPGFSGVAVVRRGDDVLFAEARGFADQETGRANTLDTRFNIASVGKVLTASAYVKLAEEAGFDFAGARMRDLLPDHADLFAPGLTAGDLMAHRSTAARLFMTEGGIERVVAAASSADMFAAAVAAQSAPIERLEGGLAYNNANYFVLGEAVARLGGGTYEDVVRARVLDSAGAASARFTRVARAAEEELAVGYVAADFDPEAGMTREITLHDAYPRRAEDPLTGAISSAAGGLYVSASDLAKIGGALLAGKIITRADLEAMCTSQAPMPIRVFGMGCGGVDFGPGVRRWGHNGGAPGVSAEFALYPDTDVVVAILANHDRRAEPALVAFETAYFGDAAQTPEGMIIR